MYRSAASLDEYNDESTREEHLERLTLQKKAHVQTHQMNAQQQQQPQPSQIIVQYGTTTQQLKPQDFEQQHQPHQESPEERSNDAPAFSSFEIHPLAAVTAAGVNENDVFSGRGHKLKNGNTEYQKLLNSKKQLFASADHLEKTTISTSIVHGVRSLNPSGRFLKLDRRAEIKLWFEIGELAARKKVGQALRDKKRYKSPVEGDKTSGGATKRKAGAAIQNLGKQASCNANAVPRNRSNLQRESTNTRRISTTAQNIVQAPAPRPEIQHSYDNTGTYSIHPNHYQPCLQQYQSVQQIMVARVPLVLSDHREDQRLTSLHQPTFVDAHIISAAHLRPASNDKHPALYYQAPQQALAEGPFIPAAPLPPANNHQRWIPHHQHPQQTLVEDIFLPAAPLPLLNNDQCLAWHHQLYDPCIPAAPLSPLNNDQCLAWHHQLYDPCIPSAPLSPLNNDQCLARHYQPPQQTFVADPFISAAPLPLANNDQHLAPHHQPLQQTIEVPFFPTALSPLAYIDQPLVPHHRPPQQAIGDPHVHVAPLPLAKNDRTNPNFC
jgi:hypothetical protein